SPPSQCFSFCSLTASGLKPRKYRAISLFGPEAVNSLFFAYFPNQSFRYKPVRIYLVPLLVHRKLGFYSQAGPPNAVWSVDQNNLELRRSILRVALEDRVQQHRYRIWPLGRCENLEAATTL